MPTDSSLDGKVGGGIWLVKPAETRTLNYKLQGKDDLILLKAAPMSGHLYSRPLSVS